MGRRVERVLYVLGVASNGIPGSMQHLDVLLKTLAQDLFDVIVVLSTPAGSPDPHPSSCNLWVQKKTTETQGPCPGLVVSVSALWHISQTQERRHDVSDTWSAAARLTA